MNVATLCVRRVSESDALNYHALRVQSLEGMVQPIEPQVREELETGAMGMARLLVRYGIEGTRVWGVFDDETLVGVLCLSSRLGFYPVAEARHCGAYTLTSYRGTRVSGALMRSAPGWIDRHQPLRSTLAQVER